jgi:para-nitrobenzyl esterase
MKNRIVKGELRDAENWKRLKEEGKMSSRIKDNWRKKFLFALTLLLGVAALCGANVSATVPEEGLVIVTQEGSVKGFECTSASVPGCSGSGVEKFLGIPYAVPPVGALRWTPPQPHGAWRGVFDATNFGSICTQGDTISGTTGSEDCLTLNVFRPAQHNADDHSSHEDRDERLPIMVWIHGGAFVADASPDYDPTPLVEKGVIVVTINYRLGYLGFFAHPALDAEGHLNANYGLMDQQLALKWVQRNIAAFGGDPSHVTIFGQSAGGISVYAHLASPAASGLFHRAIAESGTPTLFQNVDTVPLLVDAERKGIAIAANVGCGNQTAQCLRATPAAAIVAQQTDGLLPIKDGTVLPQTLNVALATGHFNRVPMIAGVTHDEYRYIVALHYDLVGHPLRDTEYAAAVSDLLKQDETTPLLHLLINNKYPLSNYNAPAGTQRAPLALGALGTDYQWACGTRNAVRLLSRYVPTFAYEFNDPNAYSLRLGIPPLSFAPGAAHGAEIPYLFNFGLYVAPFTPDQRQLSEATISYWTEFAKTGNPNSENTPTWPLYRSETDQFQSFIPPTPTVKSNFDADHQCSSLWNKQ